MEKDPLKLSHEENLQGSLDHGLDNIIINEIQLLLAEKRTSLATLEPGLRSLCYPFPY